MKKKKEKARGSAHIKTIVTQKLIRSAGKISSIDYSTRENFYVDAEVSDEESLKISPLTREENGLCFISSKVYSEKNPTDKLRCHITIDDIDRKK